MNRYITQFRQLKHQAQQDNHRLALTLNEEMSSNQDWLDALLHVFNNHVVVQWCLRPTLSQSGVHHCHQGNAFLGSEIDLLLVDLAGGFDANSFNSLCGCLRGGGLLIFYNLSGLTLMPSYGNQWLLRALNDLPVFSLSNKSMIDLDNTSVVHRHYLEAGFTEQSAAIQDIIKVALGRSNRPLVITADRGRGKTSALGLAVAQLFQQKSSYKVIVCAPLLSSVEAAFDHARSQLGHCSYGKGRLDYLDCTFQFMAPDALLMQQPQCDLLLIDEAAAIPVPTLIELSQSYSRVVFSTTQHGYEGCGRGFSLKFIDWLRSHSPSLRFRHLIQPIRWSDADPLECWINSTFLIKSTLPTLNLPAFNAKDLNYRRLSKAQLFANPELTASLFTILINAHYQTSLNDLFSLLDDDAISLVAVSFDHHIIGCAMVVSEGELDQDTTYAISMGERRPKGHLAPVTLINQLGCVSASTLRCERIMRIAIHPQYCRRQIGRTLVNFISSTSEADYLATSFGLTTDLLEFWNSTGFIPVKLGSKRDHVSGTYSALYLRSSLVSFIDPLYRQFCVTFPLLIQSQFTQLPPELVQRLLCHSFHIEPPVQIPFGLIHRYALGGANYESVEAVIRLIIQCYPSSNQFLSTLMVAKVLQNRSWAESCRLFKFTGKKEVERALRHDIGKWYENLQCKGYG
jgi:tRNA(Met) cytidine acetyltransferase